jgi:hypothetical protein
VYSGIIIDCFVRYPVQVAATVIVRNTVKHRVSKPEILERNQEDIEVRLPVKIQMRNDSGLISSRATIRSIHTLYSKMIRQLRSNSQNTSHPYHQDNIPYLSPSSLIPSLPFQPTLSSYA